MANGYNESEYSVENSIEIKTKSGIQVVELRVQPPPDEQALALRAWIVEKGIPTEPRYLSKYIAITGCTDLLLFYLEDQAAQLDSDWARITAEPEVHISELLWFEVIENHATGRTSCGSLRMY